MPSIRRVFVPADRSRAWPVGDWIPLAADEFELLVRDAEARSEPRAAVIDRAEYSATLDGDAVGGQCQLDVRRFVDRPAALSLGPLRVLLTNLRWADGVLATWGLAPNGETVLIVDRPRGQIVADWRAPTRRLSISQEVSLQLPAAGVSSMTIDLAADRVLRSSVGDLESAAPAANGLRRWHIHLGHAHACRLLIRPASSSAADPAALLVHQDISGVVRPQGLRMQCDFQLEYLGAPRRDVEFSMSPEVQVLFVQLADGRALTWRETSAPGEKRLTVELPAVEMATRPTLRLQGTVPTVLDRTWTLPRVQVADSVLLDGQIALRVDGPLELALLKLQGCRQAGVVAEATGGEVTLLKQFEPDPAIEVLIRSRPFDATCRVTNRLDADEPHATLRSDVAWTVRSGELFATRYRIADGWDVHDIEMQDGDDADLSGWSVAAEPGRGRVLTVSFRNSLAAERAKWLRVLLRRTAVEPTPARFMPVVVPLDTDDVEQQVTHRDSSDAAASTANGGAAADRLRVLSLQLDSFLTWSSAGDDRHVARFQLQVAVGTDPVRFEWSLPDSAELTRVMVNGHDLPPRTDGTVWSVDLDPRRLRRDLAPSRRTPGTSAAAKDDAVTCEVDVEYRQPSVIGFGPVERTVVLPRVALSIDRFAWRVAASERIVLDGDPRGLVPLADATSEDWRPRLFGPLGRRRDAGMFNPLGPGSWIDAWSTLRRGSEALDPARAVDPDDSEWFRVGASAGKAWSFESRSVPSEIRLRMWRESQANLLAWTALTGCLLVGLLLRLWRARRIDWLTVVIGLAAVAMTLLASPVVASISGGCVTGLVLAQLLPWTWIRRPAASGPRSALDVPAGSTRSFVVSPAVRMVIGVTTAAWGVSAVAQVAEEPPAPAPPAFNVLIPTGTDGRPLEEPTIVYVTSALHARLRELQQLHRGWRQRELPEYLISSASYVGDWDTDERLRVTAKFVVHVLSADETVPVEIRLGAGGLEKMEDCRVNGQPHALFPNAAQDASGFVVPLSGIGRDAGGKTGDASPVPENVQPPTSPADGKSPPRLGAIRVRTDTIELRVRPQIETESEGVSAKLDVRQVVDSSVVLNRSVRWPVLEVIGLRNASATMPMPAVADQPLSGWLVSPEHLHFRWSAQSLPARDVAAIESRSLCLVDVQNTHLLYHYQCSGKVTAGEVRVLPLRVPRQAVVRSVRVRDTSSPAVPELPNQFPAVETIEVAAASVSSGPAAASWLRPIAIELPRALPAEFLLELEAVLALPPESTDVLMPVADLLPSDAQSLTVTTAVPIVAVRAPVVMVVDVSAVDAEAVQPTSSDDIVAVWTDVSKLAATFAVNGPTTLRCQMSRPRPLRTGLSLLEVRVGSGRLDWTWTADVETHATPAYQHQLRIDPRLRIVDASVTEDAAERLLRWSRAGDLVTLFLSDKTSSRQSLRIHAVMPVQAPQEVPLPRGELLNATLSGPELTLLHGLDVAIEVVQPTNLPRADADGEREEVQDRDRLAGRFQLEGVSDTILLRVTLPEASATSNGLDSALGTSATKGFDRVAEATQRRLGGDWTVADVRRTAGAIGVWIVVALAALWFRRFEFRNWLNQHETTGLIMLGAVWWIWWTPSWLGLAIVMAAVARRMLHGPHATQPLPEAPDGQFPLTI